MKKIGIFALSLLVIGLDQLTKYWAMTVLLPYQSVSCLPMLSWTLSFNSGAAFSFLSTAGAWHTWFFLSLSSMMSLFLIAWIVRLDERARLELSALALILGGALGNLLDRLRLGFVVDFIDVFYQSHHWPVFNIADSAICIGGALLLLDLIKKSAWNTRS